MRTIRVKQGEERRLRRGHYWIYANEIVDDLKSFSPGEDVTVLDYKKAPLGSGTINPHSLITVRLHSRKAEQELNSEFLFRKINSAWNLRQQLGYKDVARVVHGEGDGLPGLIIDRFGDIAAIQLNTFGMDSRLEQVRESIKEVFPSAKQVFMTNSPARQREGLKLETIIPDELNKGTVYYNQDELEWPVILAEGQKTGTYLDQVNSRREIASVSKNAKVLDTFCYTGGFGMLAAARGAKQVTLIDRSEKALDVAGEAFKRNKLAQPSYFTTDLLRDEISSSEIGGPFDIVICDPPPMVKNRSRKAEGMRKMVDLFSNAISWLGDNGLIALFSCSHHIQMQDFDEIIKRSARKSRRSLRRLTRLQAGADHPVAIAHPETEYLHGALYDVS